MAIKFFNVKSGESRIAKTEPMISAFWGSSNLSPNATKGQDMGWRLAPEVVVRIKQIRQDEDLMEKIAKDFQIPQENLTDTDLLWFISGEYEKVARVADPAKDFTSEYEANIRRAEGIKDVPVKSEEQIRAEVRAEVEAETRAKIEAETRAKIEAEAAEKAALGVQAADVEVEKGEPAKIDVKVEEKTENVTVRQKSSENKDRNTKS